MPLTWAAPAFLAAAIVCSSMVAAKASGVVPGRKLATVSPAPAPMKRRREMLRFVMTSSLEIVRVFCRGSFDARPPLSRPQPWCDIQSASAVVIAGLDPAIHHLAKKMDARDIGEPSGLASGKPKDELRDAVLRTA